MSRTEAHAPWWTRAPWLEPVHATNCENYVRRPWQRGPVQPCTLPAEAVRSANRLPNYTYTLCLWEPVWPPYSRMHKLFGSHVPGWYVDHVWHNPERVRERDQLGKMVKEYNATGGIEDGDFPNWQARYSAVWYWD